MYDNFKPTTPEEVKNRITVMRLGAMDEMHSMIERELNALNHIQSVQLLFATYMDDLAVLDGDLLLTVQRKYELAGWIFRIKSTAAKKDGNEWEVEIDFPQS